MARVNFVIGMSNVNRTSIYEDELVKLLGFVRVICGKVFFAKGSLYEGFDDIWRKDCFVGGEKQMFSMSNIIGIVLGWF